MELAIIFAIAAFVAGFVIASLFEYRQRKLKIIEDSIRRSLLEDVASERAEFKDQIGDLQKQVKGLQRDLVSIQRATQEQVSTLQTDLQAARENSLRFEQALFAQIASNTTMGTEISELKAALEAQTAENVRLAALISELREQVSRLLEADIGGHISTLEMTQEDQHTVTNGLIDGVEILIQQLIDQGITPKWRPAGKFPE